MECPAKNGNDMQNKQACMQEHMAEWWLVFKHLLLHTNTLAICAMSAAPTWLEALQKLKIDDLPINKKADMMIDCLLKAGRGYKQVLQPSAFVCHPDNGSGQNVHSKGKALASIGFSYAKLGQSVCFELPKDQAKKSKVMQANDQLHVVSQSMLPKSTGHERFQTVSTSHVTCFLKSVEQQCRTCEDELSAGGFLSFDLLSAKQDDLKAMINKGWEWICLYAEAEDALQWLPAFLQQALNSGQAFWNYWLPFGFFALSFCVQHVHVCFLWNQLFLRWSQHCKTFKWSRNSLHDCQAFVCRAQLEEGGAASCSKQACLPELY